MNRVTQIDELSEEEQILWDRLLVRNSDACFDVKQSPQYCSHLVAQYADDLIRERRQRQTRR